MGAKRATPVVALVAALVVGACCLVSAIVVVVNQREPDELGVGVVRESKWAILWVVIAGWILVATALLLLKRLTKRK
jgi:hypothetical protein